MLREIHMVNSFQFTRTARLVLAHRISRKSILFACWVHISSKLIYIFLGLLYQISIADEQRGALVQSLGVDVQDILAAV